LIFFSFYVPLIILQSIIEVSVSVSFRLLIHLPSRFGLKVLWILNQDALDCSWIVILDTVTATTVQVRNYNAFLSDYFSHSQMLLLSFLPLNASPVVMWQVIGIALTSTYRILINKQWNFLIFYGLFWIFRLVQNINFFPNF